MAGELAIFILQKENTHIAMHIARGLSFRSSRHGLPSERKLALQMEYGMYCCILHKTCSIVRYCLRARHPPRLHASGKHEPLVPIHAEPHGEAGLAWGCQRRDASGEYLTQAGVTAQHHHDAAPRGVGHDSARSPASACATPGANPMLLLSETACSYL